MAVVAAVVVAGTVVTAALAVMSGHGYWPLPVVMGEVIFLQPMMIAHHTVW